MTLQEIRVSGLLELYIIGALNDEEKAIVEDTIYEYPQLKNDLQELGATLEGYARLHKIEPPAELKVKILKEAMESKPSQVTRPRKDRQTKRSSSRKSNRNNSMLESIPVWPIAASILLLSTIGFWWKSYSASNNLDTKLSAIEAQLEDCENQRSDTEAQLIVLNALSEPDNKIVSVEPTDKYPTTALYFHNNDVSDKNYLQISELPDLGADQSFQLWSLKGSDAPVPLDVFQGNEDRIIEVRHVDGTDAYAITIEPKGGSQAPNLDELIGVFSLAS